MSEFDEEITEDMLSEYENDEMSKMFKEVIFNAPSRDLYIRTALYAEWVIDKWLEEKFNIPEKTLEHPGFFFDLKLDILINSGKLIEPYKSNVKEISKIRNRYAHKLEPDENAIKQMIQTMKRPPAGMTFVNVITAESHPILFFKLVSVGTITEMHLALEENRALTPES